MARDPSGDQVFRDFFAVRSPALQRTDYLLVGDWGLAEDLVQTALIKTYLTWRDRDGVAAVGAYARTVLVHTAGRWWREYPGVWIGPDTMVVQGLDERFYRYQVGQPTGVEVAVTGMPPGGKVSLVRKLS